MPNAILAMSLFSFLFQTECTYVYIRTLHRFIQMTKRCDFLFIYQTKSLIVQQTWTAAISKGSNISTMGSMGWTGFLSENHAKIALGGVCTAPCPCLVQAQQFKKYSAVLCSVKVGFLFTFSARVAWRPYKSGLHHVASHMSATEHHIAHVGACSGANSKYLVYVSLEHWLAQAVVHWYPSSVLLVLLLQFSQIHKDYSLPAEKRFWLGQ